MFGFWYEQGPLYTDSYSANLYFYNDYIQLYWRVSKYHQFDLKLEEIRNDVLICNLQASLIHYNNNTYYKTVYKLLALEVQIEFHSIIIHSWIRLSILLT